jgi:hypothetical protein
MIARRGRLSFLGLAISVCAWGQSVISTRSGVVHFFEGSVYLDGEKLESHLGKFHAIPQGGELRTEQGRAEVLLTPSVFLRLGESSAIRMIANDLSRTRVELLAGTAIVDAAEQNRDTSVTLIYRDWNVTFVEQGTYRIDSEKPRLWVSHGKAEVSTAAGGKPVVVEQGMDLPLAAVLVPEQSLNRPADALSSWAEGRAQSISADNAIAANIDDPGSVDTASLGPADFTYFPMLGVAPVGTGLYGSSTLVGLSQPGFYSLYLPGYTYRPLILGVLPGGLRNPFRTTSTSGFSTTRLGVAPPHFGVTSSPTRIGVSPSVPTHMPGPHPIPTHPIAPPRAIGHR